MAGLPKIGIEPQSFSFPTSSVPITPVPEAAVRLSTDVNNQAKYLSHIIMKQRQLVNDRESINYFRDAQTKLMENVSSITDPKTADETYKIGVNDILDDMKEKYPYMSPETQVQLTKIADSKLTSFHIHSIKKMDAQLQKDKVASDATAIRLASTSSPEEGQQIVKEQIDFINRTSMSDAEKKNRTTKLVAKYHESLWNNIVDQNPQAALGMTREEAGVSAQSHRQGQSSALQKIEHQMTIDNLQSKQEKQKFAEDAESGAYTDNPAMLEMLRNSGMITERSYRIGKAQIPPNERSKAALESILNEVKWGNADDVQEFANNWISGNDTLSAAEHSYLMGQVKNMKSKIKDPMFEHALNLRDGLKEFAYGNGKLYLDMKTSPDPVSTRQYHIIMSDILKRLEHAKSFDDQTKIADDAQKKLSILFHIGEKKPHVPGTVLSQDEINQLSGVLK